jgi:hypothetical protein
MVEMQEVEMTLLFNVEAEEISWLGVCHLEQKSLISVGGPGKPATRTRG